MEILLNKSRSKRGSNVSSSINVSLEGKTKYLPSNDIIDTVNAAEQYLKERETGTKYRLSFQVNVVSSNVLCNDITEVVRNEGSDDAECLNFGVYDSRSSDAFFYKSKDDLYKGSSSYKTESAIRDTQLSNFGFVYHCGKDIFNNHMIRNNSFKAINRLKNDNGKDKNFNTIFDMMRGWDGEDIKDYVYLPAPTTKKAEIKMHTYEYDDIDSYEVALENKMILDYDGYVGFTNRSKIKMFDKWDEGAELPINRPIMYKNAGDFIDLYPTRDLFSFNPKFNKFRRRVEKNWNYCITYPSESRTEGFDFIETRKKEGYDEPVNALKALYFDETTMNDSQQSQVVIYSLVPHGLRRDDFINVYLAPNIGGEYVRSAISNVRVAEIVDDYIFTIFNPGANLSSKWIEVSQLTDDDPYEVSGQYLISKDEEETYKIITSTQRANVDPLNQQLSFKRVDGDAECEYYVRIFSKLPNFKFAEELITDENLYALNGELLKKYQTTDREFESHVSKNAFSQNLYGDKNAQIVFTDDIDINHLRDNRNRPLTEIFLTVIKNNKGYREWYGIEQSINIKSENVEYSHCFGKVNCAFKYSTEASVDETLQNVLALSNNNKTSNGNGINLKTTIGQTVNVPSNKDQDEIDYYNQFQFIGDVVCYSPSTMLEETLQYVYHRFNTAQRELNSQTSTAYNLLSSFSYDNIKYDDYDYNPFEVETTTVRRENKYEGYYYQPHYRIPIRTFASLQTATPPRLMTRTIVGQGSGIVEIVVCGRHNMSIGDKFLIYDQQEVKKYTCEVLEIANASHLKVRCYDDTDTDVGDSVFNGDQETLRSQFRILNTTNMGVPSYSELMLDGSCRVQWREVVANGFSNNRDEIKEYPFSNGRFYINQNIIIYNRRQDPDGTYGLYSKEMPSDLPGRIMSVDNIDDSIPEDEIIC